jgi:hypothetical protein
MSAELGPIRWAPEELLEVLTDVAVSVVSRYGIEGSPDGHRQALRAALARVVLGPAGAPAAGAGAEGRQRLEALAVVAADAACRVALGRGVQGPPLGLELEFWKDLCQAILHSPLAREFLRRPDRSPDGKDHQR